MKRFGFVAIMGRPNAGKSTLLNAIVGQKLAAVSSKPQTTRGRVRGIWTTETVQLAFTDTPGLHRVSQQKVLNSMMNREAWAGVNEADLSLYLVSLQEGFRPEDQDFLNNVIKASGERPLLLLASQEDRFKRSEALSRLAQLNEDLNKHIDPALHPKVAEGFSLISAKRPEQVAALLEQLSALAPEGDWLFPEDQVSDQPRTQMASELIREHLFRCLGNEVPYQTTVIVERWDESPKLTEILANVIVARPSLKPLLIGKAGSKIKEIGTLARLSLERELETKVFLELHVSVSSDWVNDEARVRSFHGLN